MTLTLVLFLFFSGTMTVNRLHHSHKVACRHPRWYQAEFPGANKPVCKPPVPESEFPLYVR